jgi:tryptophan synthase alpha chain
MSYINPILRIGLSRFAERGARAGVDAVIATDLPVEEAKEYRKAMRGAGIGTVFLAAPTSPPDRVARIARASSAFLYYVSLTGVTGARKRLAPDLARRLDRVRDLSPVPVSVGFGISTPAQAKAVAAHADAVVVGSALVHVVEEERTDAARLRALSAKVDGILRALSPGARR